MKFAIKGHPTRGKEVIQILESLGGINDGLHEGNNTDCYYELHGNFIWCVSTKGINFKYYTLEEFEKKFPFKIGDRIISVKTNFIGTITNLKENGCYYIQYDNGNIGCTFGQNLKLYKEMKEERNITLTLDKAQEWYKKGGELKEIALQAFTERELNPLPRSWKEFVKSTKFTFNGSLEFINGFGQWNNGCLPNKSIGESSEIWDKHVALFQLEQLRNCWRQSWEPNWNDAKQAKCYICYYQGKFKISTLYETRCFLSFPTYEMAKEFLECFRDLIEKAGDLI